MVLSSESGRLDPKGFTEVSHFDGLLNAESVGQSRARQQTTRTLARKMEQNQRASFILYRSRILQSRQNLGKSKKGLMLGVRVTSCGNREYW